MSLFAYFGCSWYLEKSKVDKLSKCLVFKLWNDKIITVVRCLCWTHCCMPTALSASVGIIMERTGVVNCRWSRKAQGAVSWHSCAKCTNSFLLLSIQSARGETEDRDRMLTEGSETFTHVCLWDSVCLCALRRQANGEYSRKVPNKNCCISVYQRWYIMSAVLKQNCSLCSLALLTHLKVSWSWLLTPARRLLLNDPQRLMKWWCC